MDGLFDHRALRPRTAPFLEGYHPTGERASAAPPGVIPSW